MMSGSKDGLRKISNNYAGMKQEREPPFMGKVGARDLCDNYFIAFTDLHF